jgi:hypothetical protein
MNYKNISIGILINQLVTERGVEIPRICNFFKCTEEQVKDMYTQKSIDTELLLKWSKLLEYDFFRLYSQHLILYAPPSVEKFINPEKKSLLPQFRKRIYTKEIIDFIMEQIESGEMTQTEVVEKYRIPKTTLHKWISKHINKPG